MQRGEERMTDRKYVGDAAAEERGGGSTQEFFGGGADHDRASIASEEQKTVFKTCHDGIHIFAKRTENFVDAAKLLADLGNFSSDLAEFVGATDEFFFLGGDG